MHVLLIGSGGREHALAWKIAKSPLLTRLTSAPGSYAMGKLGALASISPTDVDAIAAFVLEQAVDLVVIGPDAAVEAGVADRMAELGVPCFGPSRAAGRLESSKAFTKAFAERHNLPTAAFVTCETAAEAKAALDQFQAPYVIKADGLAAGKGVIIAETRAEAEAAVDDMLGGKFGGAGARVVIEEFMVGEELSLFALSDGNSFRLFGEAQDHKRAFDGDQGPNTGGMGTYSPAPVGTAALLLEAETKLITPTLEGIAEEGTPYRGVLYAGLMATAAGVKLVEYNARFGDPECQVLMLRLKNDLLPYLHACAVGELAKLPPLEWRDEAAVCVVMAAKGYPGEPEKGSVIEGAEADFGEDVVVFHAGTAKRADGALTAAGGRVLNVCALGESFEAARAKAYAAVEKIHWPEGFYRRDIGWRAIGR